MKLDFLKQAAKRATRPLLRPLLFRLNRPMVLLQPQFADIHRLIESVNARVDQAQQEGGRRQRTIDDLARVWLRVRNDLAVLEAQTQELTMRVHAPHEEARQDTAPVDTLRHAFDERDTQTQGTLRFLLDRVEFVRREMMFELSYGAGRSARPTGSVGAIGDVISSILEPAKVDLAKAQGNLKLNLGCGHIPLAGYVNVDARDVPGVDVVADVGILPFDAGTVDEVFSSHLMEHFPQEELKRRLLPHWRTMLKTGGVLRAIVPDGEAMLNGVAEGTYGFEDFREVLFGSQDYNGDFHFNLLTPASLTKLVREAGFTNVEIPIRGRRNGQCFEFEISAVR